MINYLITGISLGSIYAIIALGYTMVYGIAKMLNFAHGDVIMIGGYMCFCATAYLGWPAPMGVLLAVVVCTVLGVVIERTAYKPLRSAPALAVLITAIGVSYFLQNAALLIWGANPVSFTSVVGMGAIEVGGLVGHGHILDVFALAVAGVQGHGHVVHTVDGAVLEGGHDLAGAHRHGRGAPGIVVVQEDGAFGDADGLSGQLGHVMDGAGILRGADGAEADALQGQQAGAGAGGKRGDRPGRTA